MALRASCRANGRSRARLVRVRKRAAAQPDFRIRPYTGCGYRSDQRELSQGELHSFISPRKSLCLCLFLPIKSNYDVFSPNQAIDFFQRVLQIEEDNGEIWSALGMLQLLFACCRCSERIGAGHCYLMQDDLQKAYSAYQQALYLLPNPKVNVPPRIHILLYAHRVRRTPSCGTVLASFTTDTDPSIMRRKLSLLSFACVKVSCY